MTADFVDIQRGDNVTIIENSSGFQSIDNHSNGLSYSLGGCLLPIIAVIVTAIVIVVNL